MGLEKVLTASMESMAVNVGLSCVGAYLSVVMVREFIPIFIGRNMFGVDQCKPKRPASDVHKVAEPMGVVTAAVYLTIMFLFIPVPFMQWINDDDESKFPYQKLLAFLGGLLSICCSVLLGFADDVLDLRWRHKLLFPTLSALPLLMVYGATGLSTNVAVPTALHAYVGVTSVNLGVLFYTYMLMTAVFCFNAINILAGINGLEAGQSVVLAASIAVYNVVQLVRLESQVWYHQLSLYFLLPYLATTSVLLYYNWYPARVFVGDTFCYYSGMVFAVVAILGHFPKTLALFLVPQAFNFVYSLPQLFKLVPCPRHRLPKYDAASDTVSMSMADFKSASLSPVGTLIIRLLSTLGLLHVEHRLDADGVAYTRVNNMTLLNLCLKLLGPMHERRLTVVLLGVQLACSAAAFVVRFWLAALVYDVVN